MHQARRRLGMPLVGAESGVAEPLHVAQGVPNLDDGHANAVVQKPDDDAVGVQHYGAARCDVVDLADHLDEVGRRIAQLLGKDHHAPRRIAPLTIALDKLEVDRSAIALSTDTSDALLLRQQPTERIERCQKEGCYADGDLAHGCSLCGHRKPIRTRRLFRKPTGLYGVLPRTPQLPVNGDRRSEVTLYRQ